MLKAFAAFDIQKCVRSALFANKFNTCLIIRLKFKKCLCQPLSLIWYILNVTSIWIYNQTDFMRINNFKVNSDLLFELGKISDNYIIYILWYFGIRLLFFKSNLVYVLCLEYDLCSSRNFSRFPPPLQHMTSQKVRPTFQT